MFDTSLEHEYATAAGLGLGAQAFYEAGVIGAICDDATRARLQAIGESYDWSALDSSSDAATVAS
jgi:aminodeoxyfutalosine deaminase